MARYVLVHGGFTDGTYWDAVASRLRAAGHAVDVVDRLPSSGPAGAVLGGRDDDVRAVTAVVERDEEPVVLVSHSGSGVVAAELADHPRIVHTVHVAALVPPRGESPFGLLQASGARSDWIVPGDDGTFGVVEDLGLLHAVLCDDVDREIAERHLARLGRQSVDSVVAPANAPDPTHAVTYVLTERDRTFPPSGQEETAARVADHVVRLPSAHQPMVSMPDRLADVLLEAVTAGVTPQR